VRTGPLFLSPPPEGGLDLVTNRQGAIKPFFGLLSKYTQKDHDGGLMYRNPPGKRTLVNSYESDFILLGYFSLVQCVMLWWCVSGLVYLVLSQ